MLTNSFRRKKSTTTDRRRGKARLDTWWFASLRWGTEVFSATHTQQIVTHVLQGPTGPSASEDPWPCTNAALMRNWNLYGWAERIREEHTSWEEEACSSGLQGNVILRRMEDWRDDGEGAAQTTRHAWGSMIDWVSIISENVNLIDKCLGTIEIWRPSFSSRNYQPLFVIHGLSCIYWQMLWSV